MASMRRKTYAELEPRSVGVVTTSKRTQTAHGQTAVCSAGICARASSDWKPLHVGFGDLKSHRGLAGRPRSEGQPEQKREGNKFSSSHAPASRALT